MDTPRAEAARWLAELDRIARGNMLTCATSALLGLGVTALINSAGRTVWRHNAQRIAYRALVQKLTDQIARNRIQIKAREHTRSATRSSLAYGKFRLDPTPANAVALALANFNAEHRNADDEYVSALRLAERQLRNVVRVVESCTGIYVTDQETGETFAEGFK